MADSRFTTQKLSGSAAVTINKTLRDTYRLLSATLLFSGLTAFLSMALGLGRGASLILFLASFVMLFVVHRTANSGKGLLAVFAFTGLFGASIGPTVGFYLSLANGPQIVMQALGATGLIFLTLSAYATTTKRDFSFLGGFLFIGLIVAILFAVANIFLGIPALSLGISAAIVLIMSGFILFDTQRIVRGGETNYIIATVALYLNIANLFLSLLHLIAAFSGRD